MCESGRVVGEGAGAHGVDYADYFGVGVSPVEAKKSKFSIPSNTISAPASAAFI